MQVKRILSMLLATALIFTTSMVTVNAETAETVESIETFEVGVVAKTATPVSVSPAIYKSGDEVSVKISAEQNTGITILKFSIKFDSNALEFIDYTSANLFSDAVEGVYAYSNSICYTLMMSDVSTATGEMLTLNFRVKDTYCGNIDIYAEVFDKQDKNCINGLSIVPFVGGNTSFTAHDIDANIGVVTEPTCTEQGYTTYSCANCDMTVIGNYVTANGHTEAEAVEENRVEANCTNSGSYDKVVYCEVCDTELSRENFIINALGHTEAEAVEENRVEADCTNDGSYETVVYCSSCGEELSREKYVIAAHGHDLIHHEAQTPTCTEIGWEAYDTCSKCDYTTYKELAALGHDLIHHEAQTPTCTEIGWEAYDTCSKCDYTTYKELAVLGHDLIHHDAQDPTCTEIGWEAYDTCSKCDYTTYKELAVLGHDLIHHDAQDPTCTEIGWEAYDTCSRCEYTTYNELAALDHDLIHHDAQAPTCTEIGWEAYDTCSKCDYTTYKELTALGHDLTHHEAQAPTCTEIGWEAYDTCSKCDYTTYKELAALGHTYGESTIVEPEYKVDGYTTHTCKVCNHEEKYDITPALTYILGDTNGNEVVDSDDAINLLYYTLLPENNPVNQKSDFDGDGDVDSDDAIYLLYHTLLPDDYPLHK